MTIKMRRAPVDSIDAKLEEATRVRDAWCASLASDPTSKAAMMGLIESTQRVSALRFERDECIRAFFYR